MKNLNGGQIIILIMLGLMGLTYLISSNKDPNAGKSPAPTIPLSAEPVDTSSQHKPAWPPPTHYTVEVHYAMDSLKISNYHWGLGGFGVVALVTITFDNRAAEPAKGVVLKATFHGENGMKLGEKVLTCYSVIPAHRKKTVRDLNFGFVPSQTHSLGLSIEAAGGM